MAQRRHRKPESMREVTHRHLVVRKRVHDPYPRWIRQGLEHFARVLDRVLDREARCGALHLPCIERARQYGFGDRHPHTLAPVQLVCLVLS